MKWEATYIISRSNFVKVFHSLFFLKVLPISLQVSKCCITPLVCNPFNLQQNPSCWLECENLQKKHFLWSFLSLPTRNNNKKFNPTFAGIGFCCWEILEKIASIPLKFMAVLSGIWKPSAMALLKRFKPSVAQWICWWRSGPAMNGWFDGNP